MPFTGGFSPGPEKYGGGDGASGAPLLQRVFEAIAQARGLAYDKTTGSIVGAENMAMARAVALTLFGTNLRLANEMNPAYATEGGLLPRWEKILAQPPMPGDSGYQRRARLAGALGRFGVPNTTQPVVDACVEVLGPLFAGLLLFGPNTATSWWPGYGGGPSQSTGLDFYPPCKVTGVSGNLVTVSNLTAVPTSAAGASIVLSNTGAAGNAGTFVVHQYVSPTSVVAVNNGSPSAPDYGSGGSSGSPTMRWSMPNPPAPFTSSTAHVDVLANPAAVPGYLNADGTLNGAFFALVNRLNPVLDLMLPADVTFDWYVNSSHGGAGFYLDEQNLDVEAFDI